MKKNLGRLLLIYLLLCSVLEASTYQWNLELNKKNVVANEAVYFSYKCVFNDRAELYVIEFNPVTDNENYTVKLLSEQEQLVGTHRENSYEYVLFVKKGGDFKLNLEAVVKKTNKDSIENTVLGRDNRSYEEYSITKVPLQQIALDVRDVDQKLVGEFSMQTQHDDANISQFEPFHLEIMLEGKGDMKLLKPFKFEIQDVKVFEEKPQLNAELTKEGTQGSWSQKFAFVSDRDFTIPSQQLEYYDLREKTVKILQTKAIQITVKKNTFQKEELLDQPKENKFHFKQEYLYYLLTFIAGFIAAKIKFKSRKNEDDTTNKLCEKIAQAKSLEQVSILLILNDAQKYQEVIEKIETKQIKAVKEVAKLICG